MFEILKAPAVAVASLQKILRAFPEQRQLGGFDLLEIDPASAWRQIGGIKPLSGDPSPVSQAIQADKKRISGKRGDGGIGRIAEPGWRKRQYLPQTQLRLEQKIRELVGFRPKVADPVARGQRSGM